jgi:hypothetical protein
MVQHTCQRSAKLFGIRPDGVRAAFSVWKGDHSMNVGWQIF